MIIVRAILGTGEPPPKGSPRALLMPIADMSHHFKMTAELGQRTQPFSKDVAEERTQLVSVLVHAADLANPILPLRRAVKLMVDVAREFQNQAREERRLMLPVTSFMDIKGQVSETSKEVAKLNVGFVDFVVSPLWKTIGQMFPELGFVIGRLLVIARVAVSQ